MRNAGGYELIVSPDEVREGDTFSCKHCNRVVRVPVKARPEDTGGLCKLCMGLICPSCVNEMRCDPLEKKLERWEAKEAALRSYDLAT